MMRTLIDPINILQMCSGTSVMNRRYDRYVAPAMRPNFVDVSIFLFSDQMKNTMIAVYAPRKKFSP